MKAFEAVSVPDIHTGRGAPEARGQKCAESRDDDTRRWSSRAARAGRHPFVSPTLGGELRAGARDLPLVAPGRESEVATSSALFRCRGLGRCDSRCALGEVARRTGGTAATAPVAEGLRPSRSLHGTMRGGEREAALAAPHDQEAALKGLVNRLGYQGGR